MVEAFRLARLAVRLREIEGRREEILALQRVKLAEIEETLRAAGARAAEAAQRRPEREAAVARLLAELVRAEISRDAEIESL